MSKAGPPDVAGDGVGGKRRWEELTSSQDGLSHSIRHEPCVPGGPVLAAGDAES